MILGALKEKNNKEKRILLSLETIKKFSKDNLTILVSEGYGLNSNIANRIKHVNGSIIELELVS